MRSSFISTVTRVNKATTAVNDTSLCSTILVMFLRIHPGRPGWNFPYEQTTKFVPVTEPARLPGSYEEALVFFVLTWRIIDEFQNSIFKTVVGMGTFIGWHKTLCKKQRACSALFFFFFLQYYTLGTSLQKTKVTYITITTYKWLITIPTNIAYNTNNITTFLSGVNPK